MNCPKCGSSKTEEQAESGEWWWYCYNCNNEWTVWDEIKEARKIVVNKP